MTHYDLDGVGCYVLLNKLFKFEKKIYCGYKKVRENLAGRMQRELLRLEDPRALGKSKLFESYKIYAWHFDEQRGKKPKEYINEHIKPEDRIATPEEIRKMQGRNFGRPEFEKELLEKKRVKKEK